jgi:hypothetical protein
MAWVGRHWCDFGSRSVRGTLRIGVLDALVWIVLFPPFSCHMERSTTEASPGFEQRGVGSGFPSDSACQLESSSAQFSCISFEVLAGVHPEGCSGSSRRILCLKAHLFVLRRAMVVGMVTGCEETGVTHAHTTNKKFKKGEIEALDMNINNKKRPESRKGKRGQEKTTDKAVVQDPSLPSPCLANPSTNTNPSTPPPCLSAHPFPYAPRPCFRPSNPSHPGKPIIQP